MALGRVSELAGKAQKRFGGSRRNKFRFAATPTISEVSNGIA
jgi:hypothetical protein